MAEDDAAAAAAAAKAAAEKQRLERLKRILKRSISDNRSIVIQYLETSPSNDAANRVAVLIDVWKVDLDKLFDVDEQLMGLLDQTKPIADLTKLEEAIAKEGEQFKRDLLKYAAKLKNMQDSLSTPISPKKPSRQSLNNSTVETSSGSFLRLQDIPVPLFDGQFVNYPDWRAEFDAMIDQNGDLNEFHKMYLLRRALDTDGAREFLRDYGKSGDLYTPVMEQLQKTYYNRRRIIAEHFATIVDLPQIKSSSIRENVDKVNRVIRGLTVCGLTTEHMSPLIAFLVARKLPEKLRMDWDNSNHDYSTYPSFEPMANFLLNRSFAYETSSFSSPSEKPTEKSSSSKKSTPSNSNSGKPKGSSNPEKKAFAANKSSKTVVPPTCVVCKNVHWLNRCPVFAGKSALERFELVKNHTLCLKCFSPNHTVSTCTWKNCVYCNGNHNNLLHRENSRNNSTDNVGSNGTPNQVPQTSNLSTSSANGGTSTNLSICALTSNKSVFLSTAVVKVQGRTKTELGRILLDTGSEVTLVTREFCDRAKLDLQRSESTTELIGINEGGIPATLTLSTKCVLRSRISNFSIAINAEKKGAKQPNEEIKDARKASNGIVGEATAGNINRNRSPSKMTKYVECWGADKPFANITESTLAKNIGLTSIAMIESNLLPNKGNWFDCKKCLNSEDLHPVFLWFKDKNREDSYHNKTDNEFHHYLSFTIVLFVGMTLIQILLDHTNIVLYGTYVPTLAAIIFFLYLCHLRSNHEDVTLSSTTAHVDDEPPGTESIVSKSFYLRLIIFCVTTVLVSLCSVVTLFSHDGESNASKNITIFLNETDGLLNIPPPSYSDKFTEFYKYYQYSSIITLAVMSVFLRISFIVKFCLMMISASVHVLIYIQKWNISYDPPHDEPFPELPWQLKLLLPIVVIIVLLHVLDRQIEFTARTDFLWQQKLKVEQEEVETMRGINKILLENILPAHVAERFLQERKTQELYHERYSCIAVMFASIPNYKEFYDENDVNKQGLECLRLLNEIICDFDKLLLKPKFSSIEKIKTIGSTYMLASGLRPGKEDAGEETKQQEHSIVVLVEFAIALMTILDQINRESFQRFKLRIGINHGPVIAGVVGAQKPQYDIWGNTVNVASRMDSCGKMGRIQVTEDTAKILMAAGYTCECRGPTFVKGKGTLVTYFVKTPFDDK